MIEQDTLVSRKSVEEDRLFWSWLESSLQDIHAVDLYKELKRNDLWSQEDPRALYCRVLALSILRGDEADQVDILKIKIDSLLKVNNQTVLTSLLDTIFLVNETSNKLPPLPGIALSSLSWLNQNFSEAEIIDAANICISHPSQMETVVIPLIREIRSSTAFLEEITLRENTGLAPMKNKSRLLRL